MTIISIYRLSSFYLRYDNRDWKYRDKSKYRNIAQPYSKDASGSHLIWLMSDRGTQLRWKGSVRIIPATDQWSQPTLSTFPVAGNQNSRRIPTTFDSALTDSFHIQFLRAKEWEDRLLRMSLWRVFRFLLFTQVQAGYLAPMLRKFLRCLTRLLRSFTK
jgi:hypothetical protein